MYSATRFDDVVLLLTGPVPGGEQRCRAHPDGRSTVTGCDLLVVVDGRLRLVWWTSVR